MSNLNKTITLPLNTIKNQLTLVKDNTKSRNNQNYLYRFGKISPLFEKNKFLIEQENNQTIAPVKISAIDSNLSYLDLGIPAISKEIKTYNSSPMKRNNTSPSLFNCSNSHWAMNKNCSSQNKPEVNETETQTENILNNNLGDKNKWFITNYWKLTIFFVLGLFFLWFMLIIQIKKSSSSTTPFSGSKAKNCKETHCNLIHTTKEGWDIINQNKISSKVAI
jgi:hypothetical protein